jgi:hypothetical protein
LEARAPSTILWRVEMEAEVSCRLMIFSLESCWMKGKLVGGVYVLDGIDSEKSESIDPVQSTKQYPNSNPVPRKLRFGPCILLTN